MHEPEFKAMVALEAIKGEMTMVKMSNKFEAQKQHIAQCPGSPIKKLLSSASTVFDKEGKTGKNTGKTALNCTKTAQKLPDKIGQLTIANDL